jgi:hypothetical protein
LSKSLRHVIDFLYKQKNSDFSGKGKGASCGEIEVTKKREISNLKRSKESEKPCMGKEK